MYTLEQKVDLIMRYIATSDEATKNEIKNAMVEALNEAVEAEPYVTPKHDVERLIVAVFKEVGVPPHLIGYKYAVYAVQLCISNPEYLRELTKGLYVDIAEKFDTTPSRVERAIRHSIEVMFYHGNMDNIVAAFGNIINFNKGKFTNGEFIAASANEVILRMNKEG